MRDGLPPPPIPAVKAPSSSFIPGGLALEMFLPRALQNAATSISPGAGSGVLFILTDAFRAGFFFGAGFLMIGWLRNRKNRASR